MRAVFLDRDGTIVEERGYITSPDQISLIPGSTEAIRELREANWKVIVISNQAGVAKGLSTLESLAAINRRMLELLAAGGASLDGIYCCPHHPAGTVPEFTRECECRKPKPGLLHQAEREFGIDLTKSVMVGDSKRDIEAGHAVGIRSVLVLTGFGEKTRADGVLTDHIAPNLRSAAAWIRQVAP